MNSRVFLLVNQNAWARATKLSFSLITRRGHSIGKRKKKNWKEKQEILKRKEI